MECQKTLYSNVHVVHRHEPLGQVVRPLRWKVRVHQEMLAHKAYGNIELQALYIFMWVLQERQLLY